MRPHPSTVDRMGAAIGRLVVTLGAVAALVACTRVATVPPPVSSPVVASASARVSAPPAAAEPPRVGEVAVAVTTVAVPLNPGDPAQVTLGPFRYAGGIAVSAGDGGRLHGLSDLVVSPDGRLEAVGDLGLSVRARLVFDASQRLSGLADVRVAPLTGLDGRPLADKVDADAEGLALLPNGDRLVSFERRHRVWRYAVDGSVHVAPVPDGRFGDNEGLEALTADPAAAADAYIAGSEADGVTWSCRLSQPACRRGPTVDKPADFGLVAVATLPDGRVAYLLRAWDEQRGNRITLQVAGRGGVEARADWSAPVTVDNFEGLAVVPRADGGVRFYLLSDDNESPAQRTLLLAFDWQPAR